MLPYVPKIQFRTPRVSENIFDFFLSYVRRILSKTGIAQEKCCYVETFFSQRQPEQKLILPDFFSDLNIILNEATFVESFDRY